MKIKKICLTNKGKEFTEETIEKVKEIEEKVFKKINEKEMDIVIEFLREQAKSFKEEVNKVIQKEDKKNE